MYRMFAHLLGLLMCLATASTAAQAPPAGATYPIKDAPAALRPAVQRADLIILSIQDAALLELTRLLAEGGPARAVQVCHMSATALINRLAREEGIAAGRTAARLRSPTNAPKPWAAPIVARYADGKAAAVDGFVVDLGSRIGVMRPIAQRPVCSSCHGLEEQLNPRVRDELKDRYPADRATGFKEGDLRGWIWVEVPKEQPRSGS